MENIISDRVTEKVTSHLKLKSGAVKTPRELLSVVGLAEPMPSVVQKILQIGDELEPKIYCTSDEKTFATQWNALSGTWHFLMHDYFDSNGTFQRDPRRSIESVFALRGAALYNVVHETSHAMIYDIGLRGLLRKMDSAHSPQQPAYNIHLFGEMFAEFVSHYELGTNSHSYWEKHWKPFMETSVGQKINAGIAAERAGLRSPQERAMLILNSYFNRSEDPLPLNIDSIWDNSELVAIWLSQRFYAVKTQRSARVWWENYWSHPQMRAFVQDFIPDTPSPFWLASTGQVIEFGTIDQLAAKFPTILYDWGRPPKKIEPHMHARRIVQRTAMSICQLLRLTEYSGLQVNASAREAIASKVLFARKELLQLWNTLQKPLGDVESQECAVIRNRAHEISVKLVSDLQTISRKVILFVHPLVNGLSMNETDVDLKVLNAFNEDQKEVALDVIKRRKFEALTSIRDDLVQVFKISNDKDLLKVIGEADLLRLKLSQVMNLTSTSSEQDVFGELSEWYRKSVENRALVQGYEWSWMIERPYIDPLIGFRIS